MRLRSGFLSVEAQLHWYATVCGECPAGCGTLVRTREGRAVKVEGNPEHPVNRGGLCIRGQSSLQGLYNPDRIAGPQRRRVTDEAAGRSVLEPVAWDDAQQALVDRLQTLRDAGRGDRIVLITPPLTGTMATLVSAWTDAVGGARWVRYEPVAYEPTRRANERVFGRAELPHYNFARPDLLVSFGADFLETFGSPVGYARDHAGQRQVRNGEKARFVQIEPRLSMTGASADVWHAVPPETEGLVAAAMVRTIVDERRAQRVPDAVIEQIASSMARRRTRLPERRGLPPTRSARWPAPDGFVCPRCAGRRAYAISARRRWQCVACRHQVSLTSGTVLHNTKLPLMQWFWAAYLMTTDTRGAPSPTRRWVRAVVV